MKEDPFFPSELTVGDTTYRRGEMVKTPDGLQGKLLSITVSSKGKFLLVEDPRRGKQFEKVADR